MKNPGDKRVCDLGVYWTAGSSEGIRTSNLAVNSRLLYR